MDSALLNNLISEHSDPGMMTDEEHRRITECLECCVFSNDDWVIEIGFYYGNSTCFIARVLEAMGFPKAQIVTIDTLKYMAMEEGNGYANFSAFTDRIDQYNLQGVVLPFIGQSSRALRFLAKGAAFACVDGSHKYQNVYDDVCGVARLVSSGGLIYVHDRSRQYPEVAPAIDAALADYPNLSVDNYGERDAILRVNSL